MTSPYFYLYLDEFLSNQWGHTAWALMNGGITQGYTCTARRDRLGQVPA